MEIFYFFCIFVLCDKIFFEIQKFSIKLLDFSILKAKKSDGNGLGYSASPVKNCSFSVAVFRLHRVIPSV